MKKNFLVKIRVNRVLEEGLVKTVTEQYLVGAVSFTDVECTIFSEIGEDLEVKSIVPQNISEIIKNDECEIWFKAKVNFVADGCKKVPVNMLVQADDIQGAREGLTKGMTGSMADYEIASISETKIIDVLSL